MDEVCYPLQAVCQDYQKPSEVCAHHRYYFLQQSEKKTSTVSYHASSICGFTSSTEEVTHYSIRIALSSDHSNLILLEPVLSYRSPQLCTAEYEEKIMSCMCETNEFWKACMKLLHGQGVSSALLVSHINLHLHTHVLSLKSIFKLVSERVLNTHRGQLNKNASLSNQLYYKNDCNKEGNYQWSLCFTALICYKEILFPL